MRLHSRQHISLSLFKANYQSLRKVAPHQNILFMVKANAYEHGVCEIVEFAFKELKITEFGVATLQEALFLRDHLPDLHFDLYVFSDLELMNEDFYHHYIDKRIIPVITKMPELEFILSHEKLTGLPLCLKFNTGMNRLGFNENELETISTLLLAKKRDLYHVMTHIACAGQSMKKNKSNLRQIESFEKIKNFFKESNIAMKYTSLANSGAIEQGVGLSETHIRPGILLYGPSSLRPEIRQNSLCSTQIISTLEGEVIHVFDVERGQPIGYGAMPVPHEGKVAIISLGYGDGISQNYRGTNITLNGDQGIIFGRVNMDMMSVLFKSDARVKVGDIIPIWGHSREQFHELSDKINLSTYEIFCQISTRVPKTYHIDY